MTTSNSWTGGTSQTTVFHLRTGHRRHETTPEKDRPRLTQPCASAAQRTRRRNTVFLQTCPHLTLPPRGERPDLRGPRSTPNSVWGNGYDLLQTCLHLSLPPRGERPDLRGPRSTPNSERTAMTSCRPALTSPCHREAKDLTSGGHAPHQTLRGRR